MSTNNNNNKGSNRQPKMENLQRFAIDLNERANSGKLDPVSFQLDHIKGLMEQNGVMIHFAESVVPFLAKEGFDPQFGARPVKRAINKHLLNELSKAILADKVERNKTIEVYANEEGLGFRNV